jgi:Tol biopolymer transport system component/predicted Ser/Thr protein kinase
VSESILPVGVSGAALQSLRCRIRRKPIARDYNGARMALASGTKLGPYEIQSLLGAGGMGEVYRARDNRLDREVAIKVLPSHLSQNPEFRARFDREAKTISGLQHPHICVLYDVGRQDDVDFLVMEYLEGETLAARLARKPLTPDETLHIAVEVADALDKAHRSGIVHRDLKPGNVMLTKAGTKLLDFGLAKLQALTAGAQSSAPAFSAVVTVATMASPVTVAGTVVGTMQYMSPEQIQGKEADARSDIFAFGAMLYEMLTGKRAFEGKSQLSVASAVLEKDPDPISVVQPLTPPALEHLVRTCLAKDPDQRFQNAHDLKLQLQWISAGGSQVGMPKVVVSQRKSRQKVVAAALLLGWLLAVAAAVLAGIYANRLTSAQQLVRAQIEQPPGFDFADVLYGAPALSPDAQQIAIVVSQNNKRTIFVQRLSSGKSDPLVGTEGGTFPFWSPDGKYLGFFSNGKLRKIEAAGGPAQVLCDAPEGRGAAWNEQGTIVFAPNIGGQLQRVSDGGGTPEDATPGRKNDKQFTNRNPTFLPDGKHFLFIQRSGNDAVGSVYAGTLDGGEPKQILPVGSNLAYSDGFLFYLKDGTLTAQPFDPAGLRLNGKPFPIAESIEYYNPRDIGFFSVSRNVLVYRQSALESRVLVWLDSNGNELDHWGEPAPFSGGTFSPSSRLAVLVRANANGHGNSLWLTDTERKTITRLTPDSDLDQRGLASADGKSTLTSASSGYHSVLLQRPLTSSGKEENLAEKNLADLDGSFFVESLSRDGRYAFFTVQDAQTGFDIYSMDLMGDRKLVPVVNGPYNELDARLSPDDKWLAYTSNENGNLELYLASFPGGGSKWQVSSAGVSFSAGNNSSGTNGTMSVADWSADSKSLYYRQGDKIYSVEVRTGNGKPEFSAPKELMSIPHDVDLISILPDGKRTLATRPVGQRTVSPMNLAVNWQHLLR